MKRKINVVRHLLRHNQQFIVEDYVEMVEEPERDRVNSSLQTFFNRRVSDDTENSGRRTGTATTARLVGLYRLTMTVSCVLRPKP